MGAQCPGGDVVEALEGYWRLQMIEVDGYEWLPDADAECAVEGASEETNCMFPEGSFLFGGWTDAPMYCTIVPAISAKLVCVRPSTSGTNLSGQVINRRASKSSKSGSDDDGIVNASDVEEESIAAVGSARVYRCPLGACGENNQCNENRTGALCGVCSPGYAMTTEGCSAQVCASEEELKPWRLAMMIVGGTFATIVWFLLSWRPVVPEADWLMAQILQGIVSIFSAFTCLSDTAGDSEETTAGCMDMINTVWDLFSWFIDKIQVAGKFWRDNNCPQYMKIYITFFQILGSFTMVRVYARARAHAIVCMYLCVYVCVSSQAPFPLSPSASASL